MSGHILNLPAPWGAGAVLGLRPWIYQPEPAPLGPALIRQVPAQGDFAGVMQELERLANQAGIDLAPAGRRDWFLLEGDLGRARVTDCMHLAPGGPLQGYLVRLADTRPCLHLEDAA